MDVATSFLPVLQVFATGMTQPTFQNLLILVYGWLLAPRRTIIGMVRGSGTDRHHAAFHRLFASARWSIDAVGLAVFDLITAAMSTVFLVIDDTLIPRTGLKIFGTGMQRTAPCCPAGGMSSPVGGTVGWCCAWCWKVGTFRASTSHCRCCAGCT